MTVRNFLHHSPQIDSQAYVDETALVIGQVNLGANSSIWPMTVVRGDIHQITIGKYSNIQDGSVCHVTHAGQFNPNGFALTVGNNVTVGHGVILHGCTIEDNCLIGMGSIVMDGAHLEPYVMLGAKCLVSPGKRLASGFLYHGSPAKQVRELTDEECKFIDYSAKYYATLKDMHTTNTD